MGRFLLTLALLTVLFLGGPGGEGDYKVSFTNNCQVAHFSSVHTSYIYVLVLAYGNGGQLLYSDYLNTAPLDGVFDISFPVPRQKPWIQQKVAVYIQFPDNLSEGPFYGTCGGQGIKPLR